MAAPCEGFRVPRAPEPDQSLAAAIKGLREQRAMTQEALAFGAGLSVGTLARVEAARTTPSWDSVRRIIDALGVSFAELAVALEAQP